MTQYFTGLLWDKTKIIVLYFASSLCPSSLSALSQAFVFAPFPFPFLQAKMTKVQDLHSCNDIVHQRNGYFLLSTFPAPRELTSSPNAHTDVSIEQQVHLWESAEYLGVTLHQKLCFYRHKMAIIRFLTESIIAVLYQSCSLGKRHLIWQRY